MSDNRGIRVFVSSTFRDMVEDRNELMTQAWPELRRFCRERQVELVEVDLRWGIAEEQATRKETLKLCLDEIRACRPFFIGLLGERYGWTPGADAFTADLEEEQPWLRGLAGKSVTELEILHGVLNNPEMAGRSFFYFRDPAYSQPRGAEFLPEDAEAAAKQAALKETIRQVSAASRQPVAKGFKALVAGFIGKKPNSKPIPLREDYPDPHTLANLVLKDLKDAIEAQFPIEEIPDPHTREARDHEAFAETRRRTYIGRPGYFARLNRHAAGDGGPLVLVGDSGSGKSALVANWLQHWRDQHPNDFLFQHYIGGTPDSADHWPLMARLIAEIKRWSNDPEDAPRTHDDLLRDFPLWLAKARIKAEHDGVRCIVVLDALNQLEEHDHARLLGWLPDHPFTGGLRFIVSTLPVKPPADDPEKVVDDPLQVVTQRGWETLRVESLTPDERRQMIEHYLARFGKKLDAARLDRLATTPASANPLYLKILLDELRVTGTHDRLDERLNDYLSAPDIPALLKQVLARSQHDYERDRPGLVSESLGLIWAARRGLSENELLHLLKPANQEKLPLATWSPLRAALEEELVDRGGILNFAHDFLRSAVETAFVPDEARRDELRLQLAVDFEQQPITARSCDELPWLLQQTRQKGPLRACLLNMDRFLEIHERNEEELRRYWIALGEERTMGGPYLAAFEEWSQRPALGDSRISFAANKLTVFLKDAALFGEAQPLMRRTLTMVERVYGPNHPNVAICLNSISQLLQDTNRLDEAELLMRRGLEIDERIYGPDRPEVATDLNNLATLLYTTNRLDEAEPMMRRALEIDERSLGPDHPEIATFLNTLALLLKTTNRLDEAEPLYRRALAILEKSLGLNHPKIAKALNNLARLLQAANRLNEAEPLMRRALEIDEQSYGPDHPEVATNLNNLALLLKAANRLDEAEPLYRRALAILEKSLGLDHPLVSHALNNLARLLQDTNRLAEAEPMMRRALKIDETNYGPDHPQVAICLSIIAQLLKGSNRLDEAEALMRKAISILQKSHGGTHPDLATALINLAELLRDTNRLAEAEPLYRRALEIDEQSYGPDHPNVAHRLNNLAGLLRATSRLAEAEPLMRRALGIDERSLGLEHPNVLMDLNNLATMLQNMNRMAEAEPFMRRTLTLWENSLGPDNPDVAIRLNNLALLLQDTNRLDEAEPMMRRALEVFLKITRSTGSLNPHLMVAIDNYKELLEEMGRSREQILATLHQMVPELF
jgi:tetratricopeptide (TPR) repeat protein